MPSNMGSPNARSAQGLIRFLPAVVPVVEALPALLTRCESVLPTRCRCAWKLC